MGRGSSDDDKPELELPVVAAPRTRDRYALVADPRFVVPWFGELHPRVSTPSSSVDREALFDFNVLLLPIGDYLLVHMIPTRRPIPSWPEDDHCSSYISRASLDCLCGLAACTPSTALHALGAAPDIRSDLASLSRRITEAPQGTDVLLLAFADTPLGLGVCGPLGPKSRSLMLHLGTQTTSNSWQHELGLDAAGQCIACGSPACGLPDFFAQVGGMIKPTMSDLVERTDWQHDPKDRNWLHVAEPRLHIRTQWDENNPESYKLTIGDETFGKGRILYDSPKFICPICHVPKCRHFRSALERHQKVRSEMAAAAARTRQSGTPGPERDATRFIRSLLPGFKRRP